MNPSNPRPRLLWTWTEVYADDPALRALLDSFAQVQACDPTPVELAGLVQACEILVPRLRHEISEALIDSAPTLRLIGTPSTGSDHIAVAAAGRRGIPVVTLKDDRAFLDTVQATAELAWLLILACHRRLREALTQVEAGGWDAMAVRGHELIGRTLGIVGYGRLGTMVGRFAQAFRMKVLAADPFVRIADPWVTQVSLEQLMEQADVITLHVHLNEQTRHLIDRKMLSRVRRGAMLVNTSRGGVIDEAALLEALDDGRLSAAGLDVIEEERAADSADRPLRRYAADHPHLILTPHVGGCTVESQAKAFLHFAEKLKRQWLNRPGQPTVG